MQSTTIKYTELRCDFCGIAKVTWIYPADNFKQLLDVESEDVVEIEMMGDWASCSECYELIEKNDREALTERSVEPFNISKKNPVYERVKNRVSIIHEEFFVMRTDNPVSADNKEYKDSAEPGVIRIDTKG